MNMSIKVENIVIGDLVDYRHPPIFERRSLKASAEVSAGMAVKVGSDGAVEPATSGDEIYGISCENVVQSEKDTHVTVLIHGTVKASRVNVNKAAVEEADIQKLKSAGIYVLN